MQLFGFNPSKCKTQCRLGVGRIKLLRNKKQLAMKQLRKEVAELLRQGKQSNARIRVEAVMREHRMLQAYDILELYLELLAVRAELLSKTREIPPDMVEAICSLIYAGERVSTDLAEVAAVAKLLVGKYSGVYKEAGFPHEVVSDLTYRKWQVNENLVTCLAVTAPLPEEKLAFLEEIAKEYDVAFDKDAAALDMLPAAGKPLAVPPTAFATPVETLAAAGGGPLPLAHGWQPGAAPAAAEPPPPAAVGWQPGAPQGDSVWHRAGPAAPPPADGAGWAPPRPDDPDSQGRAVQSHIGAAAAWRQTKLAGGAAAPGADGYPGAAVGVAPGETNVGAMWGPPGAAQSSGASTPSAEKPKSPASSYSDATAAAEAAKRYSQMAQQAAQRAEEFASQQAGGGRGGGGSPGPSGGGSPGPSGGGGGGGGGGPSGKFVARTLTEIQRAYDAAPGPPSKADKMGGGSAPSAPPSAPPPAADGASTSASAAAGGIAGGNELDPSSLPSPPAAVGVPPPPPAGSELDELTARFERLKRGG